MGLYIKNLSYADDTVLSAETFKNLQRIFYWKMLIASVENRIWKSEIYADNKILLRLTIENGAITTIQKNK